MEAYASDKTLALATNPTEEINNLKDKLGDVGLTSHVEILNNLPSTSKGDDGEGDLIDNTVGAVVDALGEYSFGVVPTVKNDGGYITQAATNLFGDNRAQIISTNQDAIKGLTTIDGNALRERKEGQSSKDWDYEAYTKPDGTVAYRTNPDKKIVITDSQDESVNPAVEEYKIRISPETIKNAGINSVFTNGLNNAADEALVNQQTQQGSAEIGILNYNASHGTLVDLIETGLEKATVTLDAIPGVQDIGHVVNGSARQTGDTIAQVSHINGGNVNVFAHSQGTQQTYLGLQQHQTEIANDLSTNPTSVFTLQNAGSPVSSTSVEDLVVNGLYGGEVGIQQHIKEGEVKDVFRSQVNPGDPIGALGGNFGGVNNNAPVYTSEFWSQVGYTGTRGVPTLFDSSTSPHSGYGCVIGCGENGYTPPEIEQYYDPITKDPRPLTEYYQKINVDSSHSNVNGTSSSNTKPSTQVGIGVNQ